MSAPRGRPEHEARPGTLSADERGSATVLTVGAMGVLIMMLTGALLVVSVVRDVHRARSAADLSALAAAGPLPTGGRPDCADGSSVAMANGATLTGCDMLADGSVVVRASVSLRWSATWAGIPDRATAGARAGVISGEAAGAEPGDAP
jgi:secretion/DNA translocation related TadE-like protein